MTLHILVYDHDPDICAMLERVILARFEAVEVFSTNDLITALFHVDHQKPQIVITEAIPEMDVFHPMDVQTGDLGSVLINHVRLHQDEQIRQTMLIVAVSRLLDCVPIEFLACIGDIGAVLYTPALIDYLPEMIAAARMRFARKPRECTRICNCVDLCTCP
ncbi:MAG: hypothetical protein UT32_C0015G0009 [Parcubacteria group bacterium GW2011_GWC2_39_14]|nr:MAG: hypothetical protein UT32_C0015G0009 [Parcubacteria group bacterium GW2011_GWC2_39_14]KKR54405.1 MAG: hypothetical protein UT91_C0016G0009 [Parcubacteria group bacterium GW2011_GWA2_40_23]